MSQVIARGIKSYLAPGTYSALEGALVFLEFASAHGDRLTVQHIRDRYQCSRATAYRYLAAWKLLLARRAARAPGGAA